MTSYRGKLSNGEFILEKELAHSMENNAEPVNRVQHLSVRISMENIVRFEFHWRFIPGCCPKEASKHYTDGFRKMLPLNKIMSRRISRFFPLSLLHFSFIPRRNSNLAIEAKGKVGIRIGSRFNYFLKYQLVTQYYSYIVVMIYISIRDKQFQREALFRNKNKSSYNFFFKQLINIYLEFSVSRVSLIPI